MYREGRGLILFPLELELRLKIIQDCSRYHIRLFCSAVVRGEKDIICICIYI